MKYFIFLFIFFFGLNSCSKKSNYTSACASVPAGGKHKTVSGKEISTKYEKRSTYKNYNRRPSKLGFFRK